MSSSNISRARVHEFMGICLGCVQQTEHLLAITVSSVLKNPKLKLLEQADAERRRTLTDFVRALKTHVRLEHGFKDKLYRFRDMRNAFVHNHSEIPGWDLTTDEGREVALKFIVELIILSQGLSCTFVTVFAIVSREELGEELDEGNEHLKIVEKIFSPIARKVLKGRSWPPLVPPIPVARAR